MTSECVGESEGGVAVLARTAARPPITYLCPSLFQALSPGDVVQVSGSTGCTALLQHLLCRTLLPERWHGLTMGTGAAALMVDTDLRFSVLHAAMLMESLAWRTVRAARSAAATRARHRGEEEHATDESSHLEELTELFKLPKTKLKILIKKLVKQSLKNLVYLKCYYSTQFATTLLTIDEVLAANPRVSLVCIDSLSGFYWYDRTHTTDRWQRTEVFYNKVLAVLLDHIRRNGLVLLCVTQQLFCRSKQILDEPERASARDTSDEYKYLGRVWHDAVTHSVSIDSDLCSAACTVRVRDTNGQRAVRATLHRHGITWHEGTGGVQHPIT